MTGVIAAALVLVAASTVAACTSPHVDVPVEAAPVAPATSEIELPPAPTSDVPPTPPAPARTSNAAAPSSAWSNSEREAVQLSRESRQPLVIVFHASWSDACKKFDQVTFADPAVRARLARFVKLRIDATNEDDVTVRALMVKYRITGLPAVLLFDSAGTRHADITEFQAAEAFAQKLDTVH